MATEKKTPNAKCSFVLYSFFEVKMICASFCSVLLLYFTGSFVNTKSMSLAQKPVRVSQILCIT